MMLIISCLQIHCDTKDDDESKKKCYKFHMCDDEMDKVAALITGNQNADRVHCELLMLTQ